MGQRKGKMRITIQDIARESGYSKTSVSFAFNNPGRISGEAREKILSVAQHLGYYPDSLARNFSLQRHNCIGFLLPHAISASLKNPYIVGVLEGIGSVCQDREYTLTIISPFGESLSKAARSAAVDGLITLGMEAELQVTESIMQKHIPYVTIDGNPGAGVPSVNIDDRSAARELMEFLLNRGHRRISVISIAGKMDGSVIHSSVVARRIEGFQDALGKGIPNDEVRVYHCGCSLEEGKRTARRIVEDSWGCSVIAAMSDIIGLGCMQYLREAGIDVPGVMSVAGFDNIPESSLIVPGLTTIDQPAVLKGSNAARLLFSMLDGGDDKIPEGPVPHRLVMRGSVC